MVRLSRLQRSLLQLLECLCILDCRGLRAAPDVLAVIIGADCSLVLYRRPLGYILRDANPEPVARLSLGVELVVGRCLLVESYGRQARVDVLQSGYLISVKGGLLHVLVA